MAKRIITNKQHIILMLLYIFRFLNSKQIQEFMNHKDHRRINSWLKNLEAKEYIVREFKPAFGTLTKPAVCYLTAKGRKYIKDYYKYYFPKYLQRIANDKKVSKGFKIRCQLSADFYLTFFKHMDMASKVKNEDKNEPEQAKAIETKEKSKAHDKSSSGIGIVDRLIQVLNTSNDAKLTLNKWEFYTGSYFPSNKLADRLKPDGFIRHRTKEGSAYGLMFVIDSYTSRLMLRYLVQRIFNAISEEDWDDDVVEILHLYLLCPNNQVIVYFKRMLPTQIDQNYASYKTLKIHLATRNKMYQRKTGKIKDLKWVVISSEDEDDDDYDEVNED